MTPPGNYYAITPVAWDPNYVSELPCQIGTAGGGTCTTPGDFDLIVERDVDYWHKDGVEWTRYQLQGTVLSRSQTYKVVGAEPDATTAPSFVPYVQNVMNNASPAPDSAIPGSLSANVSRRESSACFQLFLLLAVWTAAAVPFSGILQFAYEHNGRGDHV